MPIKYANGRLAKEADAVVGLDWRGGIVNGVVITGDKSKGLPELVFQHGVYMTACPDLALGNFLHTDDAVVNTDGIHSVTAKPVAPTGAA